MLPDALRDALGALPPIAAAVRDAQFVEVLSAGTVNTVWRIDTAEQRWVIRCPQQRAETLGVDYQTEFAAHAAAADAGLAPPFVAGELKSGLLVTQWVAAPPATPGGMAAPAGLATLAERVRRLHAVAAPAVVRPTQPLTVAADLLRQAPAAPSPLDREHLEARLATLAEQIRPCLDTLCHNDLHPANVLLAAPWMFIDWEYAGRGDRRFELAAIAAYLDCSEAQFEPFLSAYGGPDTTQLRPWRALFDIVHGLWLDAAGGWGGLAPAQATALLDRLRQ